MRRLLSAPALAAALAAAGPGPALAGSTLESVRWQVARVERGLVRGWGDARVIEDGPPKLDSRLRGRVVLKNSDSKPAEGLVLRCVLSARVLPDGSKEEGTWTVPFSVDERRVSKLKSGQTLEVNLVLAPALEVYLRRLAIAGWWADRFKLSVMLDPRRGSGAPHIIEQVLEIRR